MKAENHLDAAEDYRRVLRSLDPVRDLRSYAALAFHASLHYIAYICDARLGEHRNTHSGLSRFLREEGLADLADLFDGISQIRIGCVYGSKLGRDVAERLRSLLDALLAKVEEARKAKRARRRFEERREVGALRGKDARLLRRIVEALSKLEVVKAIVLFGSLARGEETPGSDVDIMVVLDCEEPYDYLREVSRTLGEVVVQSHRDINPLLTNLRDQPEDFLDDIVREGTLLHGELVWRGRRLSPTSPAIR